MTQATGAPSNWLKTVLAWLGARAPAGGPAGMTREMRKQRFADIELVAASPLLDRDWYLTEYRDVAREGTDPAVHYVRHGADEQRDPGPGFNTAWYLSKYSDVRRSGMNPLVHYLRFGQKEGRLPIPPVSSRARISSPTRIRARPPEPKEDLPPGVDMVVPFFRDVAEGSGVLSTPKRIAVYTAIINSHDGLKLPEVVSPDCDYICFTDQSVSRPGPWKLRGFDYYNDDPTRIARYIKTHPHVYLPDYRWSIWIDGSLVIRDDLAPLVDGLAGADRIAGYPHPQRNCIYHEAQSVLEVQLDDPERVLPQVERYRAEGYPVKNGLVETRVLVRRHHHPSIVRFDNAWWKEIDTGSRRDQLSFNYIAWKLGMEPQYLSELDIRQDFRFEYHKHLNHEKGGRYKPRQTALDAATAIYPDPTLRYDYLKRPENVAEAASPLAVDIVVCVHNALDDVRACLESVVRNRGDNERLIVVDDGSGPETREYLDAFMGDKTGDVLIRHDEAQGYTRAANVGLRASTGDYAILLNSDTIVSAAWVEKLLEAGERAADIGIVGPLSNAASWQSIPAIADPAGSWAVTALPPGLSVDDVTRRCTEWSNGVFPRVPLLNGFCLAIKRAVLDQVGAFDEQGFPRGYGEEDDFMFRARDAGFTGAVATHAYVFHAKSKSFTPERRTALAKEGGAVLQSRYGKWRIQNAVQSTRNHPQLVRMRELAKPLWEEPAPAEEAGELGETAR
jgi:GT2 family glycosyltransferase